MKRHRYTEAEDLFIIDNYGIMTVPEIANTLGVSLYAAEGRVRRLQTEGRLIRQKFQRWTDDEDKYLFDNYNTMLYSEMAIKLGKTVHAVTDRIGFLRKTKGIFFHKVNWSFMNMETVRDGYPDVPWWCRQSTRNQFLAPDMYWGDKHPGAIDA